MATVEKRGDSYRITVSCGYGMDGKQIRKKITYTPSAGLTEKQIEKELKHKITAFEAEVANGNYVDASKIKLCDFYEQYLEITKSSMSPETHSNYNRIINKYIIPAMGHLKLKDIKPMHVQMFIQALQEDGVRQDGKGTALAPSSVRRYYVVLQSILGRACKLGLIAVNPAENSRIELPKNLPPKIEIFTKDETATMLCCLDSEPLMYQAMIHIAILTGCRRGEIVALKWEDVDSERKIITINKSNYKLTGEDIKTKSPKTYSSNRIISIPEYCIELLQEYHVEQNKTRVLLGDQWQDEGWIFTQWNGLPMHPQTPSRWFSKFLARHELPHRKFHALRHTSATLLLSNGTNIKTVASRLGHTQLSTTNRYVHAVTEADTAAAESLGNMFSPKEKNNKNLA